MLIHHKLADLSQYFTEDELSKYVDSYIQEGYFNQDGALYLFPVAKSTEITMLNKTDWEPFAEAAGTTVDELATTEGIVQVAQRYYEWTDAQTPDVPDDGKAFYGRDSMSNYFLISMKQMCMNCLLKRQKSNSLTQTRNWFAVSGIIITCRL